MPKVLPYSLIISIVLVCACKKEKDAPIEIREFILMDETFWHVNDDNDDKKMGFAIFPFPDSIPTNWNNPAEYKEGELFFRLKVLNKPTDKKVYYQMGLQWLGGCTSSNLKEKISDRDLFEFTQTGDFQTSQALPSFWEPDCQTDNPIDWSIPASRILLILLDEQYRPIDNRWGYGSDIQSIDDYFPMQVRFQAILVPKGQSFSGWEHYSLSE